MSEPTPMPLNPWYNEMDGGDPLRCSCGGTCDPGRTHFDAKSLPDDYLTPRMRADELGMHEMTERDMLTVSRNASRHYREQHSEQPPRWHWEGRKWLTAFPRAYISEVDKELKKRKEQAPGKRRTRRTRAHEWRRERVSARTINAILNVEDAWWQYAHTKMEHDHGEDIAQDTNVGMWAAFSYIVFGELPPENERVGELFERMHQELKAKEKKVREVFGEEA